MPGDLIKTQDGEGKDGAGKAELQEVSQLAMKTQKVIITFLALKCHNILHAREKKSLLTCFQLSNGKESLRGRATHQATAGVN